MGKNSYYFPHDYNARSDPKLMRLSMKMGMDGLGIYWCVVEMLFEQAGYIPLENIEAIAFELHSDCERIKTVLQDFGLFKFKDDKFYSDSVLRRLRKRKDKSDKARGSAEVRWNREREADANALRTQSEGNAIKERKGKEIKEEKEEMKRRNGINFDFVIENYHSLCPNMNKVEVLNGTRKGFINGRVGEYGMEKVITVLRMAGESNFLNGKNDKAWKADFEWIMRPTNFVKIMEGKYKNNINEAKRTYSPIQSITISNGQDFK